jgi:hypothetical protein
MTYLFGPKMAYTADGQIARSTSGPVYDPTDLTYSTPLTVWDAQEISSSATVAIDAQGVTEMFRSDLPIVIWKVADLPAIELVSAGGLLEQSQASAQASADSAAAAVALSAQLDANVAAHIANTASQTRAAVIAAAGTAEGGGSVEIEMIGPGDVPAAGGEPRLLVRTQTVVA